MDGLWAHATLTEVEANSRALEQCSGAPVAACDAASMYEEIRTTLVGDDEAVAVLFVEPFHGPTGQETSTSLYLGVHPGQM
jgi:hypothetical protein